MYLQNQVLSYSLPTSLLSSFAFIDLSIYFWSLDEVKSDKDTDWDCICPISMKQKQSCRTEKEILHILTISSYSHFVFSIYPKGFIMVTVFCLWNFQCSIFSLKMTIFSFIISQVSLLSLMFLACSILVNTSLSSSVWLPVPFYSSWIPKSPCPWSTTRFLFYSLMLQKGDMNSNAYKHQTSKINACIMSEWGYMKQENATLFLKGTVIISFRDDVKHPSLRQ